MKKMSNEDFIAKAYSLHGDKYDYSKVEYINSKTKVCIICPVHGEFWITPNEHLLGHGCKKCYHDRKKITTEEFIRRAKEIHGDKYDYSKVEYVNSFVKVCIICPKHGEFWQTPHGHLKGNGCPKCGNDIKYTTNTFIEKCKKYLHNSIEKCNFAAQKSIEKCKNVCCTARFRNAVNS